MLITFNNKGKKLISTVWIKVTVHCLHFNQNFQHCDLLKTEIRMLFSTFTTCDATRMNHQTTIKTHSFPPACFVLGCQHSGSAQHGGGQRSVPGNRWWWRGGRTVGAEWQGGAGRVQPNLWPWLRVNERNPDAGFFFFTGTNSAAPKRKVAPTAQYWEKMEGSQLLHFCSGAVWLLLECFRQPRFPLSVFSKLYGISLSIARAIWWWMAF